MATDIDISHYNTGTATVAANGTAVTGQGTTWQGAVRPGDMFGTHKGDGIRILSVNSNTSLTLAYPWTGGAQTEAPYEIQRTPYDLGYQKAVEDFLTALQNGNLPAFATLPGGADKLPYFNGANSMALADFPAWARALFAETGQLPNARIRNDLTPDKAFRRGNILGTVSRSGSVPTGAIIERGQNANGEYVRFADGTQICWRSGLEALYQSASILRADWLLPVAFTSGNGTVVTVSGMVLPTGARRLWAPQVFNVSNTLANIELRNDVQQPFSESDTGTIRVTAIGRWF